MQDRIAAPGLKPGQKFRLPWWLRLVLAVPGLRNLTARMLAFGPRRVRLREPAPLG